LQVSFVGSKEPEVEADSLSTILMPNLLEECLKNLLPHTGRLSPDVGFQIAELYVLVRVGHVDVE
jgi:hypothetical protein